MLVADDEAIARKRLVRLLAAMPDVAVAGECADAHEVLERVRAGGVDVVLLDIQMPELSGIEALQLFPADGPLVIFCTAHTAHAVAAFDVGAIDYLLKPIEAARLRKALDRARERDARRRYADELARFKGRGGAATAAGSAGAADPPGDRAAGPARRLARGARRRAGHRPHRRRAVPVRAVAAGAGEPPAAASASRASTGARWSTWSTSCAWSRTRSAATSPRTRGGHAVEVSRQAARELRRRLGLR